MEKFFRLQLLLAQIVESPHSDFYKERLQISKKKILALKKLALLPCSSKKDFLGTPLSDRTYINGRGFVKIIDSKSNPFLIKRILTELKEEQYGIIGHRPTVLFSDGHESLEKALWCYEQNVLPVLGESANISITDFLIYRYESDSFLGDIEILEQLFANNKNVFPYGKVFNLYGNDFSISKVQEYISPDKLNLILALPEIGAFAYSCKQHLKEGRTVFHPDKNSIIELEENIIVTKLIYMPTPVIRYKTNLTPLFCEHTCSCDTEMSFSLVS